ncbi:grpE protein homolog 2, mitochondrial [Magnolia sinica]|uniref:grpE protein homolog 2, mitochondrial n=1 Tax=Magnolia sinica TaxID=86752 RepID=UPI00265831E2|nr:grpE protein homolog 2, mitochondrial [Magnolia sinica]
MLVSRVFSRISRHACNRIRSFSSSSSSLSRQVSIRNLSNPWVPCQTTQLLHHPILGNGTLQRFGVSSSASPQPNEKETNQFANEQGAVADNDYTSQNISQDDDSKASDKMEDSDAEGDLSVDDLVKLVAEKEELLKAKHKEVEKMQDKVLRSYAETENVIDRTKRNAENSKKFAIQNFAKSLLDVADNLGRASSVVKDSFSKIDQSKDSAGAVPLLKTLLEGVEMTDKQLAEVLRKFGVEKFDPMNEQFDPNRHLAVFQVPDSSKPPGTVAAVLKSGYMLYDRIIRPAEVGVTDASSQEVDQSSSA